MKSLPMKSLNLKALHWQGRTTKRWSQRRPQLSPMTTKPPRYKLFLLSWLGIYPLITGIFLLFGPWLAQLPLALRTLLLTGLLVYLMTYWVMPKLTKLFHRWLFTA